MQMITQYSTQTSAYSVFPLHFHSRDQSYFVVFQLETVRCLSG